MEVFKWEWCDNCDIICSIATVDRVHWVVSIIRTKQPRSMKPHHIINYWNHLRHITTSVTPSVYDIVWLYDPELPNRCWVNPHCSKVNYCLHLFVLSLWHSFSLPDPPHLHCVEEWKIKMVKSAWEKKKNVSSRSAMTAAKMNGSKFKGFQLSGPRPHGAGWSTHLTGTQKCLITSSCHPLTSCKILYLAGCQQSRLCFCPGRYGHHGCSV